MSKAIFKTTQYPVQTLIDDICLFTKKLKVDSPTWKLETIDWKMKLDKMIQSSI